MTGEAGSLSHLDPEDRRVGKIEKIQLRPGMRLVSNLAHLDHQSIRIRFQSHREIRCAGSFEHHAGDSRHWLSYANPLQQRVIDRNRAAGEAARKRGVVQIEIDSLWIGQPMRFILHLILDVNYHGAGVSR